MKTAFELEVMKREAEIDREAARLVKHGMSPYAAIREAVRVVDARRKEEPHGR